MHLVRFHAEEIMASERSLGLLKIERRSSTRAGHGGKFSGRVGLIILASRFEAESRSGES